MAMIFYTSATALRLARFNVERKLVAKNKKEGFFSGIPSPAGAGLVLLPVILWIQLPDFFQQFKVASPLVGIWTILVASLMISRIPTFSIKTIRLPARLGMPVMAACALLLAALVSVPWLTLTLIGAAYMVSIPFAVRHYHKQEPDTPDEGDDIIGMDLE
jgi:CDP-diacylglycerol--serine O-phosphatidyltransferase